MIRVRFAPSPTGFLHIGGARTYLFNWLFARSQGGQVVLRIDDTDVARSTDESLQSILDGLRWMELPWDEQHYQSERREQHVEAARALLAKGAAYRDFTEQSDGEPKDPKGSDTAAWLCNPEMRELPTEESDRRAAAGEPFVIRFRTPREQGGGVPFKDLIVRKQFRKLEDIEDFALLRSDGTPTYHLASCVDDGELKISHVIRGQDHLTNTFKHILLFDALGHEVPTFGHMPLLLGPDQAKLSKRTHGRIVSVINYRDSGFLPQAFINYMALLGWSPKDNREVLTPAELIELFDLSTVLRTNSVVQFDEAAAEGDESDWAPPKAVWFNAQHLRSMPVEELLPYVQPRLEAAGWWRAEYESSEREWLLSTIDAVRKRYATLGDFRLRAAAYFSDEFPMEDKARENLEKDGVRDLLHGLADRIEASGDVTEETAEAAVRELAAAREVKAGLIINGSRAVLSGQAAGPSAFAVFSILGKRRVVARLRAA